MEESDEESDMNDLEEEGENWVFRLIRNLAKDSINREGAEMDHKTLQKYFRRMFGRMIIWQHKLRKNTVYRKIMDTVKELQDGGYDRDEAIEAAVHSRRFLLNRLITEADVSDEGDYDDEVSDEGDAESSAYEN